MADAPVGVPFDIQGFVDKAVAAGQKKIVIPKGRYRIKPHDRHHLVLRGLSDTQIVADGVEMICTETTRALTIADCKNVTVRGLTIDYDPLPFTQGRITAVSNDKKVLDVEIFAGYPPAEQALPLKAEIFAADTRVLRMEDISAQKPEVLDAGHLRIMPGHPKPTDPEQVGDIIAIGSAYAPGGSIPHALTIEHCTGVRLENIDLWASNCFGFLETDSDGTVYYRCRIDRRPASSDIVKRADPRIRSLNADANHSVGAAKGPSYIECTARWMGDDAVNIHGDYDMVTSCSGNVMRVLSKGRMPAIGDSIEIWRYDGPRIADAVVKAIEPDGMINDDEKAFLLKQRMNENIKTKWNAKAFKVTVDRAVDVPMGTLISSTRQMGNGFLIRGCSFGSNRSRGILIKASDGIIEKNTISGTRGAGILVTPEFWWLESGSANNVIVRDNVVSDCLTYPILVAATAGAGGVSPAGAHNNITVTGNTIKSSPFPQITVTSTDHVTITGNKCAATPTGTIPEWSIKSQGLDPAKLNAIETVNCDHVVVSGNKP
jgi:hypothetical protein